MVVSLVSVVLSAVDFCWMRQTSGFMQNYAMILRSLKSRLVRASANYSAVGNHRTLLSPPEEAVFSRMAANEICTLFSEVLIVCLVRAS